MLVIKLKNFKELGVRILETFCVKLFKVPKSTVGMNLEIPGESYVGYLIILLR